MQNTIRVSNQVYAALQQQAERSYQPLSELVEGWLRQRLDLERYPELEWRRGPGGWRMGIKGTAVDVYTIVGYSQAGYSPQEIAQDLLPWLSVGQIQAALRYYADYPDEIDHILAQNETEAVKSRLYRALGPAGYQQLTGVSVPSHACQESRYA